MSKRPSRTPESKGKPRKPGREYEMLVAYVLKAMDPGSEVIQGQWIEGPDGRRDTDVLVLGSLNGKPFSVLVECKDFHPKRAGRVGIGYVDALESKRRDLGMSFAMLCSNSGFAAPAIRKARRQKIGLVSLLKSGDPLIKAVILQEIYFPKVRLIDTISVDFKSVSQLSCRLDEIMYDGLPVLNWVLHRIFVILANNPHKPGKITASHTFIAPVTLQCGTELVETSGLDLYFEFVVQWFSEVVQLDASLGMYDYLSGKVSLAPGSNSYMLKGFDFDAGKPITFIPPTDDLIRSLSPGEIVVQLSLVENLDLPDKHLVPPLDEVIQPDDLASEID